MADTRNLERYMQGYSNPQGESDYSSAGGDDDGDEGKLPATDKSVDYMTPDQGPFSCSNCEYFLGDGQPCQKVSDPVESGGCCDLFERAQEGDDNQGAQAAPPKAQLPAPGKL